MVKITIKDIHRKGLHARFANPWGECNAGVLLLAAEDTRVKAFSAFYPTMRDPRPANAIDLPPMADKIACPVQVHYPGRDHLTSPATCTAPASRANIRCCSPHRPTSRIPSTCPPPACIAIVKPGMSASGSSGVTCTCMPTCPAAANRRVATTSGGPRNKAIMSWDKPTGPASTSCVSPDPQWSIPGIGTNVFGKGGFMHTTRRLVPIPAPPMEQDMEVTGPVMLKLWGSTTAKNMQFIANIMDMGPMPPEVAAAHKLLDVAAPARKVTMGWSKASHRALDPARSAPLSPYHTHENPQALEPGKVYEFNIEIWPTCWVFKAGHRIRLEIMSFDGQHHIGHLRGTDTFHHDSSRPSHLQLSVVPS